MTTPLGTIVSDRFRLDARLGDGAMGEVFQATDLRSRAPVAVKLIRDNLFLHEDVVTRFRREMEITARIDHPSVVEVRAHGVTDDGLPWLAMELIDGVTLGEELARHGALPLPRATTIARQVAEGLAAAHKLGFIHRDLKPDNVLLAEGDRVKILDFGIARARGHFNDDPDAGQVPGFLTLTRANAPLGTPNYMSPEQVCCEPLTPASDLFALGAVTYEMVAGRPPWRCHSVRDAMLAHARGAPPPLREAADRPVPGWLDATVMHLLELEPEDRPKSAAGIAALLRAGEILLATG